MTEAVGAAPASPVGTRLRPATEGRTAGPPRWPPLLVAGMLYLVLSVLVWWQAWTSHPAGVMTCACTDAGRTVWSLEWAAYALAHGHSLWHSTWLFHPTGFNLLTDTSVPGIALVMAPLTWLSGPVVSTNAASTLAPVLTSLSMFWLLRRWVTWPPAAFVGGLLYGFSPFVLVQLAFGWLNLASLALFPLMAACLDELVFRPGRRPAVIGGALGLLVAVELLVSVELALVAVGAVVVTVVLVAGYAALARPGELRSRWMVVATGLASGALVGAVAAAYPVWYFLAGPGHLGGATLWTTAVPGDLGNTLGNFLRSVGQWGPISGHQLAAEASTLGGYRGPALPAPSYLGIGTLAVAAVGLVWLRRDRRLWLLGGLGIVLAALSLRAAGGDWGPWALVDHLPLATNVVQSRFSAVVDLCAAAMVAIVVDRVGTGGPVGRHAPRQAGERAGWQPGWRVPAALVVTAAALGPVAAVLAPNLPLELQAVAVPTWFTSVAPSLPGHPVVLPYPFPTADSQSAIPWQAISGMHVVLPGGGGPAGTIARAGGQRAGFAVLHAASVPLGPAPSTSAVDLSAVRRAMAAWGVGEVVVPTDADLPAFDRGRGVRFAVGFFTAALGAAPVRQADAWVWTGVAGAPAATPVPTPAFAACTAAGSGANVARCVLRDAGLGSRAP